MTRTNIKRAGYGALSVLSGVLLVGCSLVKQPAPVQRYALPVASGTATCRQPEYRGALKIIAPQTSRFLDSERIAVRNEQHELMVYQGARWQDRAPVLLRNALVQSLQNQGCIATVISDEQAISAPLMLSGQLYAFEGNYRQQPGQVNIDIYLYLSDTRSSQLVASRRFSVTTPIAGRATEGAVAAFGQGTGQLATQVNQWLRPYLASP